MLGKANIVAMPRGADRLVPGEEISPIHKLPLFSGISAADCVLIVSRAYEKRLSRRHTLFSIGDSVQQVFLVLSGSIKITQVGLNGDEVILRLSGAGDLVGMLGFGTDCKHNSSAQTVQSCTTLLWDCTTFGSLLENFPTLRRNTFRTLEQRLHEMEQRFREISTEDVPSRLSSELIRLSSRFGYGVNGNDELRLSHTDLAQLTGTTLSTVSRLLSRWQRLGIIRTGKAGLRITDFAALQQFSQKE